MQDLFCILNPNWWWIGTLWYIYTAALILANKLCWSGALLHISLRKYKLDPDIYWILQRNINMRRWRTEGEQNLYIFLADIPWQ